MARTPRSLTTGWPGRLSLAALGLALLVWACGGPAGSGSGEAIGTGVAPVPEVEQTGNVLGESGGIQASWGDVSVGPASGSLLVAGGGRLGPEIWERFVELAGGPDSRIVVIPTASSEDRFPTNWPGTLPLLDAGAGEVVILHTRSADEADSDAFVAPLRTATGVWFPGGRQWRLVDAYLNTRVHQELFELLRRGGVVGGTSAGASIQASYLVRGDPDTNQILMAPGYEEGFGLLSGAAVDQHLLARGRENDLWDLLQRRPDILGIGLDEGTALVIQGDRAEVIGSSKVLIYDGNHPAQRARELDPGARFHLGDRMEVSDGVDEELNRSRF